MANSQNIVASLYRGLIGTTGITAVLVPALAGTNTETAGITLTAGASALVYNPTAAAGFSTIQATAVETNDFIVAAFMPDTLSTSNPAYYVRFGQGVAISEVVFERVKFGVQSTTAVGLWWIPRVLMLTRRRVQTSGNSRLSASVASANGGSETMAAHLEILRGV